MVTWPDDLWVLHTSAILALVWAAVVGIEFPDILPGECVSRPDLLLAAVVVVVQKHDRLLASLAVVPLPVVHHGAGVVLPHHVHIGQRYLLEVHVVLLVRNVLPENLDVVISVGSTLLMPESRSMHQLVYNSGQK